MSPRPRIRRSASLLGAAATAVLVASCTPPASDGGAVVVSTDDRVLEVRAAREALAEPVPAVTAEATRLVEALEEVWTLEAGSDERAARAESLRLELFRDAVGELDAVELEGDGPDVEAAAEVVDAMVADGQALLEVATDELDSLTAVPAFDERLEGLLEGWAQRGSYSQQLEAFEELAAEAEALAEEAAGRTATPDCVELWSRREQAARVLAERTEELRVLIRDRRGQEFDELRDEYGQDPYGEGALLGELDARAAEDCWSEASEAPATVEQLRERVEELEAALDPEDLGN